MSDVRERIAKICRLIYQRQLSDTAGGNVSVRSDGLVYLTPRYLGTRYHWDISPAEISVIDEHGRVIQGPEELSREVAIHLKVYEAMSLAHAVIHAHPPFSLAFAIAGVAIKPVTEPLEHIGSIDIAPYAPAHSVELAANVVATLKSKAQQLADHPIACLLPKHGVVVVGKDIEETFDALERIETNAKCLLFSRLLQNSP